MHKRSNNLRSKWLLLSVSLLAISVVSYFSYRSSTDPQQGTTGLPQQPVPPAAVETGKPQSAQVLPKESRLPDDVLLEKMPEVAKKLKAAREALCSWEKSEAKLVWDKDDSDSPNGGSLAVLQIPAPSADKREEMYGKLTASVDSFPPSSQEAALFRRKANELAKEFLEFPRSYRMVSLGGRPQIKRVTLIERYTDDPPSTLPDESGSIKTGNTENYRIDWDWLEKDSWSRKRYGHLFAVDEPGAK